MAHGGGKFLTHSPTTKNPLQKQHYLPLVLLPGGVGLAWVIVGAAWPRWWVMWLLAIAIMAGCKWLTWRAAQPAGVPGWRQAAYLFLWPGLDAEAFFYQPPPPASQRVTPAIWLLAAFNIVLGAVLIWLIAPQWPGTWVWVRGGTGLTGFILIAHCGVFQLLSYLWQRLGVVARPLMDWPLAAHSVSEFWGKGWNTAFHDMAHRFIFQPLAPRWGARGALLAVFFFSGVVHELVVTVPAGGGYGGPTLFFSLQGLAVLAERSPGGRTMGLGRGWRGWAFVLLALAATVGFAFPPVFMQNVFVPFLHACGAL